MSPPAFRFIVARTAERLDRLVADATGRGRRTVRQWLREGRVRVDGHVVRASADAAAGSEVVIDTDAATGDDGVTGLPLQVIVETGRFVVVCKPAGLHCERGKSSGSLAELLEQHYGDLSSVGERPAEAGLVHRLDRDTSGVVVAARDAAQYRRLRRAFREGRTLKQYLAIGAGRLERSVGIEWPLARRARRMAVASPHEDAQSARTTLEPLEVGENWSLVLATMSSGVMHQVRVHMAAAGHPLFGDALYGGPQLPHCGRRGQLLHALRVRVADEIDVTAGPPEDFLAAYAALRRER